ncbi:MAG: HDOD domain-containing protein [Desulfobacteraceae bacterium]|jgi:putative nucleotidyltransferase with HDIG domain
MAKIQKILKKVKTLRPIPSVIHKVLALAEDPDCALADLVEVVEHDPAATANLLKTCNSAYMGLPVKVDSVQQAVAMLGLQKVVELVMAQNLSSHLMNAQIGYQLAKGDLWKQSVAAAMVARTLAERRELLGLPAIYTAALLKDIGKVVLHEYVEGKWLNIQKFLAVKGNGFIEAEQESLGIDHATLGGIIAKEWNFSDHMVYMIENHHMINPEARNDPATATLYLADMVAMMADTGTGVDRLAYNVYEEIFNDFFLAKDELKALILSYDGFLAGARRMMEAN